MKAKVSELNPQSKEELIRSVTDIWNSIDMNTICKLIDSVNERMEAVVRCNGAQTDF